MKKFTCYLLAIILLLTCGCGKKASQDEINSITKQISVSTGQVEKLDDKLKENNITFEKIELKGNDKGALKCYYYYFSNDNVIVLYEFSESNKNYKKIAANGYIKEKDVDETTYVITHKGLVLTVNDNIPEMITIKNIVNEL